MPGLKNRDTKLEKLLETTFDNAELIDLLSEGADPNRIYDGGNSLLHLAILRRPSLIPMLLQYNVNTDVQNEEGETALHLVIREITKTNKDSRLDKKQIDNLHKEMLPLLLGKGANPNIKNKAGRTAFDMLIMGNNYVVMTKKDLEVLADHGANINDTSLFCGDTFLHWTVRYDRLDLAETLLRLGVNPNVKNHVGVTAFGVLVQKYRSEIKECDLALFVNCGADINAKLFAGGNTLLHWATKNQYSKLIKLLLKLNADPNIKNDGGQLAAVVLPAKVNKGDFTLFPTKANFIATKLKELGSLRNDKSSVVNRNL